MQRFGGSKKLANTASDMSGFKRKSLSLDRKAEIITGVDSAPSSKK